MNFHNFQSMIGSRKRAFEMKTATDSFAVAPARAKPYIEPSFTKNEFDAEKPQVLLISAVGATGKSTLAQILSNRLNLPLLSLGRHKPVGDNTLTGLLTTSFAVEQLSVIFQSLDSGEYGIIIDGIDEGRSKTTEQAFQAFLDDIARLCKRATSPSFVLLGRTQILEECWIYLEDKNISTGLLTIDPFSLNQARSYIDNFTNGSRSPQAAQYNETRDLILAKLSAAFTAADAAPEGNFLSFIGYPPVLDAIVTLLDKEQNYHRLKEQLAHSSSKNIEIELLLKIADYILARERDEKVVPNIVDALLAGLVPAIDKAQKDRVFDREEQCVRLVSHCVGVKAAFSRIPDAVLNARYEEQLAQFIVEHPFATGRDFRNAIFEAVALSILIASGNPEHHSLALQYVDSHKDNYYLVYLLELLLPDGKLPLPCLRALLGAAQEFKATNASVELSILGPDSEEQPVSTSVDVEIELAVGVSGDRSKTFSFHCSLGAAESVDLGSRLSSAFVSLPGDTILGGPREVELTAPIEITAATIDIRSKSLVVRPQASAAAEKHVILQAGKVRSDVTNLTMAGADFTIAVEDTSGLQYPLVQQMQKKAKSPQDPVIREKFLRLRKILTHFRSHSKGAMAKYRDKIEHPRVAGNVIGTAVLNQLVHDGILVLKDPLYFIQQDQVAKFLGISWTDLRKGDTSDKLLQYLRAISV
jgi:hypothetical protein